MVCRNYEKYNLENIGNYLREVLDLDDNVSIGLESKFTELGGDSFDLVEVLFYLGVDLQEIMKDEFSVLTNSGRFYLQQNARREDRQLKNREKCNHFFDLSSTRYTRDIMEKLDIYDLISIGNFADSTR